MNIEGITSGVEARYNHQLSIVTALLIVFCLLVGGKAWGQSTVNWGTASDYDGQTSSAYNSPYGRYYGWEYKVFCYRPNTLPFSGNISKIEFLPYTTNSTAGTSTSSNITINGVSDNHAMQIWMKDVEGDYSLVANTTFESYVSGATKVYSGNIPATTSGSMNAITLSTNFLHNQANSLLILVRTVANSNTGDGAVNCYYKTLSGGVNLCWYKQQDRSDPGINTSGTCITNKLPVLKVTYTASPGISLSPSSATILTGSTQTLTATRHNVTGSPTITYTSSNTSVATVSGSGTTATVTGVSEGSATITASMTYSGRTYTATSSITVLDACKPTWSGSSNYYISNFTVSSSGTILLNNSSTGTAKTTTNYYSTKSITAEPGDELSCTITMSGSGTYGFALWVDFDKDGLEADDYKFKTSGYQSTPYTGTFTIPANTPAGEYRLRILGDYNTSAPSNPCGTYTNGEAEDYKLIVVASSCPKPTNLTVSNITSSSARLAWDAGGTETSWQSFCALHGESPQWNNPYWTITNNVNSNVPANIPNPQPNTEYDFYVRANCGGGDYSEPIMITFRTACGEESVPWSEDFEGEVNASNLPYCWEKVGSGTVAVQATNVHGGSKSLKFSGASSNLVLLPEFSQELNTLQVSLWTRPESTLSSCGSFDVGYVTDASDASTFVSVKTYSYSDFPSASYAEEIVYLVSAPSGARLAFRHRPSTTSYYWFVDDINISAIPACVAPQDLSATNVVANSATLSWTDVRPATSWQYKIGSGGTAVTINSNPRIISGLTGSNDYTVYVRAACSGGGWSDWSDPVTFRTLCDATPIPYTETFEDYTGQSYSTNGVVPNCWDSYSTGSIRPHVIGSGSYYYVHDGSKSLTFYGSGYCYATLPMFEEAINTLQIKFWMQTENASNGTLTLGYITGDDNNFNTFQEIATYSNSTVMVERTTYLNAVPSTATRLVFRWYFNSQYSCCIDDINVDELPSCVPPSNLNADPVAATSATLAWAGTSSSYNLRYRYWVPDEDFSTTISSEWENKTGKLNNDGTATLSSGSRWSIGTGNGVFDSHARTEIWSTYNAWLITPQFMVGSGYTLKFDLALTYWSGTLVAPATTGTDDRFVVLVSTDNEDTWTTLREWNNSGSTYVYNNINATAIGENVSIDISAYSGQKIRIAFYGESTVSNADNYLHIDNVRVDGVTWLTSNAVSEPNTITGLTPENTYEWQVQGRCSGSTSDWSDLSSFTTIALPPCDPPSVSINGGTTPTCSGTEQTLSANVSGGTTPYSYSWEWTATGSGSSTISSNAATVSVTPSNTSATASTITYKVIVNDNAGCSNSATKEIVVKKQPNPSFSPAATTLLVGGADYNALATLNADGCSSPTWTSSPSGIVTQAGGSIHAVAQGNTTVTASYAATANYCAASANLAVVVNIPHSVTISSASAACTGSGTSITASATGFTNPQYSWSATPSTVTWSATDSETVTVTPMAAGNYTFTCEVTESGGGASYSIGDVLYTDSNGDLAPSGTACYVMSVSGNKFTVLNSITCGGPHYADGYVATTGMTGKAATEALIPLSPTSSMVKLLVDNGHYAKGWYIPSADEINAFASSSDGRSVFLSVGNFNTPAPHYTSTVSSEGKVTTFGVTRPGGTPTEIYSETTYSYNGSGPGAFLAKDFSIGVSASTSITVGQSPVIGGFPIDPSVEECGSYTITPTVSTASCVATTWQWSDGDVSTGTPSLRDIDADGDYTFYATYSSMQQYDMITQNGIRAIVVKVPTATTDGIAVPISNNTIAPNSPSTPANISDSYIANLQEAIKVNGGNTYSGSRPGFVIPAGAAGGVCRSEATINVTINNPNIQNASNYNYIWKGGTAGNATDWNTASNWYVYSGGTYSIADVVPPSSPLKNIYIGNHNCKSNLTPNVNCDNAYANNITIASDASLTISANKTLNIKGNLINEGTFSAADSSLVVFVGASDQSIGSAVTFSKVKFEQTNSGTKINAPYGITVTGTATFNKGIVNGNMTFNAKAKALNVTNYESFVAGTVTKKTGSSSETNFVFPTGSAASGQPKVLGSVQVATLAGSKTTTVTFHQKSNDNGDGSHGFTLSDYPRWWNINDMCSNDGDNRFDHVSNYEYWDISAALSGVTLKVDASSATAHFSGTAPGNGANSNICAAAHYDCWKNLGGTATVSGGTIMVSGVNIPSSITRGEVAFDGILTLGSKSEAIVLPIELTSFTATCDGKSALVEWTTATERNNDYFILERSDNAIEFTEITRVAGAGNSIEQLNYSYTDYGVHGGDNYYRLIQVDYDGTRTMTDIVVANCVEMATEDPDVLAYPNPFNDDITVVLDNFGNRPARIEVYDVLGKLIYIQKADAPQNSYQTVLYLNNLPPATYNVRVSTADFVINKKVIKQ